MSGSAIQSSCRLCARSMLFYPDTPQLECAACGTLNCHPHPEQLSSGKAAVREPDALLLKAHSYRAGCSFDQADKLYTSYIASHPDSPDLHEAHWGLAMCRFGVEHVEDPLSGKILPTCHFTSPDSLLDDPDYQEAVALAPADVREKYLATGQYVDEAQQKIRELAQTMPRFDVFLCYKHSDPGHPGQTTEDFTRAQQLYYELKERGYRVFFANITLKEYTGANYEAMVYHALSTAPVMLLFCSHPEYLETAWVRSEWSRFLRFSKKDASKKLMSLMYGMSASALPLAISQGNSVEVLNMLDAFAFNYLTKSLNNHFGASAKSQRPSVHDAHAEADADAARALTAAKAALEQRRWSDAARQLDIVDVRLDKQKHPDDAALLNIYRLLARYQLPHGSELARCAQPVETTPEWKAAMASASASLKEQLARWLIDLPATLEKLGLDAEFNPDRTEATLNASCVRDPSISSLTLPEGVVAIAADAFCDCTGLRLLRLPRSLRRIAPGVIDCSAPGFTVELYDDTPLDRNPFVHPSLDSIRLLPTDSPTLLIRNELLLQDAGDGTLAVVSSMARATQLNVPEGVTVIRSHAFSTLSSKSSPSIVLPDSVLTIENGAFAGNPRLKTIRLSERLTTIGASAFAGCTGLLEIRLPDSVTELGGSAFSGCTSLTSARLSAGLAKISPFAFNGCCALTSVELPDSIRAIGDSAFQNCSALVKLRLPANLSDLGRAAFNGCASLAEATLPKGVTALPDAAFMGCRSLKQADFVGPVVTVSRNAFSSCTGLQRLTFPQGLLEIGDAAFQHCTALQRLTLPQSVHTFGRNVLEGVGKGATIACPKNSPAEKWARSEGFPVSTGGLNPPGVIVKRLLLLPVRFALHVLIVLALICIIWYSLAAFSSGISAPSFPAGFVNVVGDFCQELFAIYKDPSNTMGAILAYILTLLYLISCARFVLIPRKPKRSRSAVK